VFRKIYSNAPCQGFAYKTGVLFLAAVALCATGMQGQQTTSRPAKTDRARKLVHKVDPAYPTDLRRLKIGGIVKLDLKISANGTVDKVSVVGGNPILADSATRAVKQWQYEPADAPSSMLLNVEFNPNSD